ISPTRLPSTMPCFAPRPERGSTTAARPGSPRWMARPERTSLLSPARSAQRGLAALVEQRDVVVVGAERVLRHVRRQQRHRLLRALGARVLGQLLALGGEADAERRALLTRHPGKDVRILGELEAQA